MRLQSRRTSFRTASLVLLAALSGGSAALAGWGYGDGFFNFQFTPQEATFLNDRSIALTNRATMGPVQNNVYANNPNAFINRLHSPGYLDRYDLDTRRAIEARVARRPTLPRERPVVAAAPAPTPAPAPAPTQTAAAAGPTLPLSSFFDRYSKLVWPTDAPTHGDLAERRTTSDLASLAVLNETKLRGIASLASVGSARTDLIEYGRPALQYLRENTTPRIADGFHLFLLSLYESIGQAAEPAAK